MYSNMFGTFSADVNRDRRTDIVCSADDGGIMVLESKDLDSGNFYDPADPWKDVLFGFCPMNPKWVNLDSIFKLLSHLSLCILEALISQIPYFCRLSFLLPYES